MGMLQIKTHTSLLTELLKTLTDMGLTNRNGHGLILVCTDLVSVLAVLVSLLMLTIQGIA